MLFFTAVLCFYRRWTLDNHMLTNLFQSFPHFPIPFSPTFYFIDLFVISQEVSMSVKTGMFL